MPTIKQQTALEKTVENGGNVTQAMRDSGYSEATINNPSNLTESAGFKELLRMHGLTERLVTRALVDDIKRKRGKRLGELALAADILGMRKSIIMSQTTKLGTKIIPVDPELKRQADKAIDDFLNSCHCEKQGEVPSEANPEV